MSEWQMGEKDEKEEEKTEKEYEKEHEKTWEEKHRRDPLSTIIWSAILIWAGISFLLDNLGYIGVGKAIDGWSLTLAGVGGIVLLSALVRLLIPEYRRPVAGSIIVGVALIAIGLGSWDLVFPLVLIVAGIVILVRMALRQS